jgi:transposase
MNIHSKNLALTLLPHAALRLVGMTIDDNVLTLTVRSVAGGAICPVCETKTVRIHSRYQRMLRDLPWGSVPVLVILKVRRFRCARRSCPRRVFTERLPDLVTPYGRSTIRYRHALRDVSFALGGNSGARLAHKLRLEASPTTLLRSLSSSPTAVAPVPRVIGVDDFAKRRGHTYGTIIVDLERHRPIALLEDRSASTLATWLKTQPTVEVICSDRSSEYTRGIAEGAPHAMAVADRWHLLKNLRESLERLLDRNAGTLREISLPTTRRVSTASTPSRDSDLTLKPAYRSPGEQSVRHAKRERRHADFVQVRELHDQSVSVREIAVQLGLHRSTVTRYVRADAFPEQANRRPPSDILAPYQDHLQRRWDEGCRNGLALLREIQALGFPGSRKQLARWVRQRRESPASSTPTKYRRAQENLALTVRDGSAAPRRASSRQLSWLLVRRPDVLTEPEQAALMKMHTACSDVAPAYLLAQQFTAMVRERRADAFASWLETASTCGVTELTSLSTSLRRDHKAILAALSTGWSNGQTEGQVNRLKMLKRQMFGRAKLDLLRSRVIGAA